MPPPGGKMRHVVFNLKGGWDVKKTLSGTASSHHTTLAEAETRAKEIVHNLGGGTVVIHGKDGKTRTVQVP